MINTILAPAATVKPATYQLGSVDAQSIRAKSNSSIVSAIIAQQRRAFIEMYGDEFGEDYLD